MGMMGKMQEMQEKVSRMQDEIENSVVKGSSGGGMVNVSLSGKGEMKSLSIDPSLLNPDEVEILEDLLIAAHGDALTRVDALKAEKMQDITSGLPLPPGMKLPF